MSIFRRHSRRLPGTLCDETPAADADLMVPLKDRGRWFRPLTPEQIQPYASFASAIGNGVAVPRIPVHEVPEPRDDSEYDVPRTPLVTDGPVTAYLRHLLDEMTADRDQLDAANGLLVAKVRELREQLAVAR